ncbi:cytochrome c oxidase subunit 3 family protein [Corallococcus exiguus]|uniref:Cytochrome c oxidase subunit 3 family protein n=3 Tax=Corallococcus TaxID=83461 RepID=A0A3A8JFQ7_9BACT|nr:MULTISPECIES: cytochrome c oxidase subunit 3 family protein [Corallococcus]NBC41086.1 cytochrome c oxidase subunit 3 family protein [Corallococcus exiguus]NNC21973.1 cytochrome c oxidase subunit 3 family protein [Corallococcus exiguus]NOK23285.1 cytochrome c oxidase subunit 3 family protein [Corallococcus carmarthensis]NPC76065.1 cytochrome c oxidase subunit 3 family protein [Corallococcus exiguus]NPD29809.1 cytochrome c oxidase subunit 3 family protein [Corallococcus exiguus]
MSSAHVTPGSVPGPKLAAHFASLEVQKHAARLGMWLFLATEILLFAGLFACYAAYRFLFPEAWAASSRSLDLTMGTINTVVLITSSFTAAMAVHYAKEGKNAMVGHMNVLTLLMAVGFLVIKFFEYKHKFHIGTLPGRYYFYEGIQLPGAPLYFTVYFASTALHALHVVIGMTVLAFATVRAYRVGDFNANNYTQVELGSMYWHLVDLVWIFLFPMLYLV